jgi:ElaB/YqjD/DUF883 family membrane-anchored ribosome-binding protein
MSQIPTPTATGNGSSISSSSTTDRLASKAHETIDRVAPKVNRAETDMRDTATKAIEGAKHLEEQAREAAERSLHTVQAYVEKNPLTAAGIAFAAGALISVLLRR